MSFEIAVACARVTFSSFLTISFPEPMCLLVSSKTRSSAIIKFPVSVSRRMRVKWPVIFYPSIIVSLWDFSAKSEMGRSLEPKGLQQQRQIFVFTSLVGVFHVIFVWNSRSPALTVSDLFTSNFSSGTLRISPRTQTYFRLSLDSAKNSLFRRNQVAAGNTSALAGYLRMRSSIKREANRHSSGNWSFQSSVSWSDQKTRGL